ncbi:ACT domain-containing protein ACR4 [Camellia lanceoleosa]|nr:ACT domain-containing protein ACR4 [Camellia lanceoleosa]
MNPPRVVIDNETCKNATVDSANKHGILLEVVQVLTDLNLIITKAYISSDGGWFMDVFNVTDQSGSKITDEEVLGYIQKNFFLMESIFIFHSNCWKILHTSPTLCQILTNCFAHFMRIVALLVYVVNQYKVACRSRERSV